MDMVTIILISLVSLIHIVDATTPTNIIQRITKSPEKLNTVLIGSKVILEWKFEFQPAKELHRIFLFRYSPISKAKITIAFMTTTTGIIENNPLQTDTYLCELAYLDNNGVGSALVKIENTQFNHTGSYGIGLESRQHYQPTIENSVLVKVVDMVADQRNVSMNTVESWIGHKTLLKCGVIHRTNIAPSFKWTRKTDIITRGIFLSRNTTSILTIEPVNNTDFGEYICEARTKMAVVKQTFLVVKIDYSRPPGDVKYTFNKENNVHTVLWKQAEKQDPQNSRKYIVQIKEPQEKQWRKFFETKKLLVSFKDVEATTMLRVCTENDIGYVESSCSKPIELIVPGRVNSTSGERGKPSHFTPWWLLIFVMASMSSILKA